MTEQEIFQNIACHPYHMELLEDLHFQPVFVSSSCTRITGLKAEEILASPGIFDNLIHPESIADWDRFLELLRTCDSPQYVELRLNTQNGGCWVARSSSFILDETGAKHQIRSTIWDITKRKQLELRLEASQHMDLMTGLANREACLEHLRTLVSKAKETASLSFSIVYIDIDRLKVINDSMGTCYGDELIIQVGRRMQEALAPTDHFFARQGGDEFIAVLNLTHPKETIRVVKMLQESFQEPFKLQDTDVLITASMGIVLGASPYNTPEDLLRTANIAMRQAKKCTRHRMKVFNARMLERAVSTMEIERDMPNALKNGEFRMLYQPIVSLENKKLTGVEALIRWQHPTRGMLAPDVFLPIAEQNDFIVQLGAWALRQACTDMRNWQLEHEEQSPLNVSVNLSARQLAQHDIVDVVKNALRDTGIPPQCLKLEITETVAMENPERTAQKLERIKALGVRISIDDFGTGYSSLSYLQSFPIDTLKVDKRFIDAMESNTSKRKIVRSVIDLAHTLKLDVVAEGIEMDEQWSMLRGLTCEWGQGFLFSKPVSHKEIGELISQGKKKKNS